MQAPPVQIIVGFAQGFAFGLGQKDDTSPQEALCAPAGGTAFSAIRQPSKPSNASLSCRYRILLGSTFLSRPLKKYVPKKRFIM